MSDFETLQVGLVEDATVLEIVLSQPKGNVLSCAMLEEIERALAEHRDGQALRMVVIRGAGGNFSFGASVPEHEKAAAPKMLATFHRVLRGVAKYPVPIAALVEGRCLGGAFELVLCCHLLFAAPNAIFACPEIKLGVFPPVLAAVGPHRMPTAACERLLLTGDDVDANAGAMLGFVTAVIAKEPDARAQVLDWYRQKLRPLSASSLRQATLAARERSPLVTSLGEALDVAERRYVTQLLETHDANEGIAAFLARRAPAWKDA
jgi:cyclohexa-1,5-dienecarbonyl-CoA hydratase